jgi:hypothetical protein
MHSSAFNFIGGSSDTASNAPSAFNFIGGESNVGATDIFGGMALSESSGGGSGGGSGGAFDFMNDGPSGGSSMNVGMEMGGIIARGTQNNKGGMQNYMNNSNSASMGTRGSSSNNMSGGDGFIGQQGAPSPSNGSSVANARGTNMTSDWPF